MTEERFWDLAEEGARVIVLGAQWLLIWPLVLLGWLASVDTRRMADTPKSESVRSTGGAVPKGDAQ